MAYSLVVTTPFGQYAEGAIISDPAAVDAVRLSEYFSAVVQVSDTIIPPPIPPPPPLDLTELQAAMAELTAAQASIQTSLDNSVTVTAQQQAALQQAVTNLSEITTAQAAALNTADVINQQQTAALQAAMTQLNGLTTQLTATETLNAQQTTSLSAQQTQIGNLSTVVTQLQARVDTLAAGGGSSTVPGGGSTLPGALADDLPLAELDGVVIVTESGAVLVGDIR